METSNHAGKQFRSMHLSKPEASRKAVDHLMNFNQPRDRQTVDSKIDSSISKRKTELKASRLVEKPADRQVYRYLWTNRTRFYSV